MHFTKLVPNIFYTDIRLGLKLFVDCLEFTIGHNEIQTNNPFCVVTLRPWGAKEFALIDGQIGIVIQQWPTSK